MGEMVMWVSLLMDKVIRLPCVSLALSVVSILF